ncbi:MAG: ABC transporter ATP-binding protein [Candidatus Woesearchaeota archaeon]|nr:ABC transporter ATP-binding protein [Candidatus Woesearchaeota archaeon]
MDEINLYVRRLSLSYGSFKLKNVSFDLSGGDILGLIGGSGSGKSTLIKAIVGLKSPEDGSILFKLNKSDYPLNDYLGYSPQQNSLYQYLTVEENIQTFADLYGVHYDDLQVRMATLLKRLNLTDHRKKRINQLSGGMQKRVDLAVTLIHSPRLIILDEPFNGLDIYLQRFIWELLVELKGQGKMIIISSHMLSDIKKNCNKFGLVYQGYYYDTLQIEDAIKKGSIQTFEGFLEGLFSQAAKK